MDDYSEKARLAGSLLGIITTIVELIVAIVGLLSFFSWGNSIFHICGIVLIVFAVINLFMGQSPVTVIVFAIAGGLIFIRYSFWDGVCVGLCIEAAIMCAGGFLMMLVAGIASRKS